MREVIGDLWTWEDERVLARVITTNGYVTKGGAAVMGRGVALQAVERFGDPLKGWLGQQLQQFGNHVHAARPKPPARPYWLVTFPVKPAQGPTGEPGWKCEAELDLIRRSAQELLYWTLGMLFDEEGVVVLPRPGCGNGRLSWDDVEPVLHEVLWQPVRVNGDELVDFGDRFVVITNQTEENR